MSRIADTFTGLRKSGRKGFIPFITAGDPDLETSMSIALKLGEMGADIIELGVPFSDPMADGPTIQRSSARALANGTSFGDVLDLASRINERCGVPIVLFTYYNPFLKFGLERFCNAARGVDGVLLTDVIGREAAAISRRLAESDIDLISLMAPSTGDQRLEQICTEARGFIYAISRPGVTGTQVEASDQAETLVSRIRQFTDMPVAVGFGISTRKLVEDVWRYADAAVVGSAIVSAIESAPETGDAVGKVEEIVTALLP